MKVTIYTDGSCRGNPNGPGGYGTVLLYTDPKGQIHRRELSEGFESSTNNRMELMAVIAGLEALIRPCEVELHSDSQYVINAFNKGWLSSWESHGWKKSNREPVLNVDLWKRLLEAAKPHRIIWVWVRGHDGDPENECCDRLAVEAALKCSRHERSNTD